MSEIDFSIRLQPHGRPTITYGVDEDINTITLTESIELLFSLNLSNGLHKFYIDFANKTNETPEMAVEIVDVTIEGMTLDRFKWAGLYYPNYPEPWASQQTKVLPHVHRHATYLGWNGRWELELECPIFTWIHKLENLGWIYS
jgi:hypothetical protein